MNPLQTSPLQALLADVPQQGLVRWIGVRPESRVDMIELEAVEARREAAMAESPHGCCKAESFAWTTPCASNPFRSFKPEAQRVRFSRLDFHSCVFANRMRLK